MEAVHTSETSLHSNETTRRYIPEDSKRHNRHRENLKSHIFLENWHSLATVNLLLASSSLLSSSHMLFTDRVRILFDDCSSLGSTLFDSLSVLNIIYFSHSPLAKTGKNPYRLWQLLTPSDWFTDSLIRRLFNDAISTEKVTHSQIWRIDVHEWYEDMELKGTIVTWTEICLVRLRKTKRSLSEYPAARHRLKPGTFQIMCTALPLSLQVHEATQ
jgi:hypothetical protein